MGWTTVHTGWDIAIQTILVINKWLTKMTIPNDKLCKAMPELAIGLCSTAPAADPIPPGGQPRFAKDGVGLMLRTPFPK